MSRLSRPSLRAWAIGLALLGLALVLAGVLDLLPTRSAPEPVRADLREQLAARHARARPPTSITVQQEVAAAPVPVVADLTCDAPRAGQPVALPLELGDLGVGLLLPCGEGAQLWAADGPPSRVARLDWQGEALLLADAEVADLDADGALDLLLVLHGSDPDQAHREGLYWLRGRRQGGFEDPERLVGARVIAATVTGGEPAPRLWLMVSEGGPTGRVQLWRVDGGAAPQRSAKWNLDPSVNDLAALPSEAQEGAGSLLVLGTAEVWRKGVEDEQPPAPVQLSAPLVGALGFSRLDGLLWVRAEDGLRPLSFGNDGEISLGSPEGPPAAEAATSLRSGRRVGVANGAVWTWQPGRPPRALGGVGGARVEALLAARGEAWLWLSGLAGAQSAGLMPLTEPWPDVGALELRLRRPNEAPFPAQLVIP